MIALTIRTDRLLLRPFSTADAPNVQKYAGDWEAARMLASIPHPYPDGLAEEWIGRHDGFRREGQSYPFVVDDGVQLVGTVGVDRKSEDEFELGYWIGRPWWGRGYVSEAAAALVDFCFGWLGVRTIHAWHLPENVASARVLHKLGFKPACAETRSSKSLCRDVVCNMMVLTKEAWASKKV